jgi:hypothetical protein
MDWYLGDGTTPWTLLQYFADLIDAYTFAHGLGGVFQTRYKVKQVPPQSDSYGGL